MKKLLAATLSFMLLGACASTPKKDTAQEKDIAAIETSSKGKERIIVEIINLDSETIGNAELTESVTGIHIKLDVEGLTAGTHGIHIHENGTCRPEDGFDSAGAHFNPYGKEHGTLNPEGPHAGDLPNIVAGNDGTVKDTIATKLVTLKEGKPESLVRRSGTSLVIHANTDDYRTNPAGNAGERIACGEIK